MGRWLQCVLMVHARRYNRHYRTTLRADIPNLRVRPFPLFNSPGPGFSRRAPVGPEDGPSVEISIGFGPEV